MLNKLVYGSVLFLCMQVSHANVSLQDQPALQQISDELVEQGLYTEQEITNIFSNVTLQPSVIKAFERPAEKLTWGDYRPLFIKQSVVDYGLKFWSMHEQDLERAEQTYGVPAQIIVAIIGVETSFGRNVGQHRIIDSLTTLGLGYERRKEFFLKELKEFLMLAKEEGVDINQQVGSYAGAMGVPQFIASSYRHYAVDFDNDGDRDLIGSVTDAIGSVANYLAEHGWQRGGSIYDDAHVSNPTLSAPFETRDRETIATIRDLSNAGVKFDNVHTADQPVSLLPLKKKNTTEYRAAFHNFYVITTYNHSVLYGAAVSELAAKLKQQR